MRLDQDQTLPAGLKLEFFAGSLGREPGSLSCSTVLASNDVISSNSDSSFFRCLESRSRPESTSESCTLVWLWPSSSPVAAAEASGGFGVPAALNSAEDGSRLVTADGSDGFWIISGGSAVFSDCLETEESGSSTASDL